MTFMNEWFKVSYDIHLYLADTQRQGRGMRKPFNENKKANILIRSRWHGEAWGKLIRSWATYVFCLGSRFGFPWLVLSCGKN